MLRLSARASGEKACGILPHRLIENRRDGKTLRCFCAGRHPPAARGEPDRVQAVCGPRLRAAVWRRASPHLRSPRSHHLVEGYVPRLVGTDRPRSARTAHAFGVAAKPPVLGPHGARIWTRRPGCRRLVMRARIWTRGEAGCPRPARRTHLDSATRVPAAGGCVHAFGLDEAGAPVGARGRLGRRTHERP